MGWIDSRTYYIKRRKSKVWDFSLHAGYGNISYGDSSSETQIRYNFAYLLKSEQIKRFSLYFLKSNNADLSKICFTL